MKVFLRMRFKCTSTFITCIIGIFIFLHCVVALNDSEFESHYDMNLLYQDGLQKVLKNAKTDECKSLIEEEFMRQIHAIVMETAMPFEGFHLSLSFFQSYCSKSYIHSTLQLKTDIMFHTQCPSITHEPYQLPYLMKERPPGSWNHSFPKKVELDMDYKTLSICYILLVHNHADFAFRIIKAILLPQHTVIIHVDKKAPDVYDWLKARTKNMVNVHMIDIADSIEV